MKGALRQEFEVAPRGSSCAVVGGKRPAYRSLISGVKISPERAGTQQFTAEDRCWSPGDLAGEVSNSTVGTLFCMTSKNRLKTDIGRLKLLLEFECDLTSDV